MSNDGGAAFPMGYHPEGNSADHQGMSLRDYFAGQALIAILFLNPKETLGVIASEAYRYAEVMVMEKQRLQSRQQGEKNG